MFRRGSTVIGSGLKIVGNVSAEGLVEVHGQIEGARGCECPEKFAPPRAPQH